jgi:TrmH family RNA methyltransferase
MMESGPDSRNDAASDRANGVAIAVVDAETPGNVGTVARSMKNFGFSELVLVDPPPLDPEGEAYGFAGQAREDVLPNATELSFDALATQYHTVACTAIPNQDDRRHVRYPVATPAEVTGELTDLEAPIAVVFGRERVGLTNLELARMDRICTIPASADYPTLNLGQAATIVCYELRELAMGADQLPDPSHERAAEAELEGLYDQFEDFLVALNHPTEKRAKAERMFRRLLGRAHPTGRETRTLRGLLRRAAERLQDETDFDA